MFVFLVGKDICSNDKFKAKQTPSNVSQGDDAAKEQPIVRLEVSKTFQRHFNKLQTEVFSFGVLFIVD